MLLLLLACGSDEAPVLVGNSIGSCSYTSPFSSQEECRDYYNTDASFAEKDCKELESSFEDGSACDVENTLGYCIFEQDGIQIRATVQGTDNSKCGTNRFGCETFARGYWQPGAACDGQDEIVVLQDPFPQPELICMDPIQGEEEGLSEDGQVCTWQIVSGATEEGRRFSNYADCSVIQRQRPYSPVDPNPRSLEADARLEDPTYVAELDWVRGQLQASACDCCHSNLAPAGASVFNSDDPNLANQFNDRGIAMGAGWISTVGFGSYPPESNNGFWRSNPDDPHLSAIPTTDPDRMVAFFENEAIFRQLNKADYYNQSYGAGPLDAQRLYQPPACSDQEGIDASGLIRWLPGRARYVYVLEKGSESPTVPPNLDTPEGTLWRVDLPMDGVPVSSSTITYGQVPDGMIQSFPLEDSPTPLVVGQQYYLYVAADVLYPISRCVFTFGEEEKGCSTVPVSPFLGSLLALSWLRRRRSL